MPELQLEEQFIRLRRTYAGQLAQQVRHLESLSARILEEDEAVPALLREMHVLLFGMVGTTATFDYPELSAIALEFATYVERLVRQGRPPRSEETFPFGSFLARMEAAERDIPKEVEAASGYCSIRYMQDENAMEREIYLLSQDEELIRKLKWDLAKSRYGVQLFQTMQELHHALDQKIPSGILLDFSRGWPSRPNPLIFPEGHDRQSNITPVVVISDQGDVKTRLEAVRLGGNHFLTRPLNYGKLLRLITIQGRDPVQEPFRVLMVEDDEILSQLYAIILEGAGIEVESLSDPYAIMEYLGRSQPDLVILDVYLPHYNGIDLACVIRQSDGFASLPILFLSSENNVRRHLAGRNLYLEETLSKPVQPATLVRTVMHLIRKHRSAHNTAKELRSALRELDHLQYVLNQHAIVSATDIQGRITFVNDRFCEISGYAPHELIGQNHRMVKSGYHPLSVYQEMWRTITSGKVWHGQIKNRRRDGTFYWVEATIVPILNEKGKPQEYISIRTDISKQKQEETRAQSMALFAEMNPAPVLRLDPEGGILRANAAAAEILGLGEGDEGRFQTLLPAAQGIDLAACIRGNGHEEFDLLLEERVFHFVIQGVAELGVAHVYGNDITSRKQMEDELRLAKEAAERANRAKSEFLSSMSHELRTPMNAVLGFAQLMLTDPMEPLTEGQADSVKEIANAGHHLLGLINEVLDLAKVEAGKLHLDLEEVPLREVVEESMKLVHTLASQRNIALKSREPGEACGDYLVSADRTRLKQVVLNLLSNAIKYNRPGGMVRLTCERPLPDRIRLNITDTGVGIPEDKLCKVFEPFNRLGAERTEVEGTGIGLLITKRLVEMMGGSIGVESRVNHGSTFWVDLPLLETIEVDVCAVGERESVIAGWGTAAPAKTFSLLYVEDTPANIKLVERILKRRPEIGLLAAPDPALGLDLAQVNQPDIILLDINLPGMDGFEVLRRLRANPLTAHIPVLAVSANAMPANIQAGLDAGFLRYLTKPLDVGSFMEALDLALRELPVRQPR